MAVKKNTEEDERKGKKKAQIASNPLALSGSPKPFQGSGPFDLLSDSAPAAGSRGDSRGGSFGSASNPFDMGGGIGGFGEPIKGPFSGNGIFDLMSGAKNPNAAGRGRSRIAPVGGDAQQELPNGLTFADYLRMANEMGLGDTTDYSAMEAQLRRNAAEGDSRLDAMYRQLRGSIDADAPGINQSYDDAGAAMAANAERARGQINGGYDAARAAQTDQFAALGIGDAAAVNEGRAQADQANAVSNVAQNELANQNLNTVNRSSANNYNTNIGNAAGLEGNVQRAALQQQLANTLAELQVKASEGANEGRRSAFSTAFSMAQNPSIFDPNYRAQPSLEDAGQDLKNQKLAFELNQMMQGNVPIGQTLQQMQGLAQQMGVDPTNQEQFLQFIEMVNKAQGVKL